MKLGEALSQRVARERLEALNKFIPVHERIKEKLQSQQQMKTDLFAGRQEMYKPITTSMESMLYGKPDDVFQPTDKKPIAGLLKEISESVKPVRQPAAGQAVVPEQAEAGQAEGGLTQDEKREEKLKVLQSRFTDDFINEVSKMSLLNKLPLYALSTFNERDKYLTKKGDSSVNTKDKWAESLYKLHTSTTRIAKDNPYYRVFFNNFDKYVDYFREKDKQMPSPADVIKTKSELLYPLTPSKKKQEQDIQRAYILEPLKTEQIKKKGPGLPFPSLAPLSMSEEEEERQGAKRKQNPYERQPIIKPSTEKKGSGISTYYDSQICPDSIVRDVSRLEVLIGGRKAGNNSPEIINESADIAQRLFQANIIDLHVYREFIDDLMEDKKYLGYHSD